ncbi:4-hydroxybenzoyl-CoA reductase subunit alpha [Ramlibacter albus]|uniref:4-hydroxybenzoyl-CoA reductase subunit alpha n=1 Tax=Ramlibacter albus TaxID=2079448 RepID=A0A923MD21_9BURK|nr:4-hydroxybenzoyl-CoA reductase subunit alpha [Ramlibacter albus]MBC5768138.1 4-hydroxybenzoyl-CoA reductase subunit alpha [Ramlibacter albus]
MNIGVRTPLIDGVEKVTGRARYTADLPLGPALVGRIHRSPVAHARIVSIDRSAALELPGVHAVITGEDFAAPYGVIPISQNEWPLARGKVRYRGEPLFAVAADDEASARAAISAVKVELEELPEYFTAAEARAADAVLLHDDRPGNLERLVEQDFGDVDAAFSAADRVLERHFECGEIAHGQIELNATVAQWEPEAQRLTVHSVTQVPYYLHLTLAQTLGLDESQVRVVKPFVGGGFGHRVEPLNFEMVTAALARAARCTVKLELTREEVFLTHRGRPHSEVTLKIGVRRNGEITAIDARVTQRGGAYGGYGLVTILYAGALLHALYKVRAVRYRGWRVYTNLPPCGAMRGHGAVNVRFAVESLLDDAAEQLGMDPFELRRANLIEAPYRTLNDLQVNSYGLAQCLDAVERASGWRERHGELPAGVGLGLACSHYVSGSAKPVHWTGEPHAVVNLKLDFDGSITILTGASDIGQGSTTLLAQVVAEVMQLPLVRIRVVCTDSALTPKDNGSYSSRVSFMVGNAALRAAEALKRLLVEAAAKRFGTDVQAVEWHGETCRAGEKELPFAQCVQAALAESGTITVKGTWSTPPETQGGKFRGAAVGSTAGFSYAAQVAQVRIDEDTGQVHVEKIWVAQDCGRAINPLALEGQIQGAVWMGLGQALAEETQYHEGLPLRANFLDYRIATMAESPPIEVTLIESMDPLGPFGAKEGSEGALHGCPPAVANAIADALGLRLDALPMSPDRILQALRERERARKRQAAAPRVKEPA